MKLLRLVSLIGALVLLPASLSIPANAFQETQIAPDTSRVGDAPEKATSGAAKNDSAAELTTPSTDAKSSDGTEISIPGLGTIGKLPKLDFGLELLYGADEDRQAASTAPKDEIEPDSEIMVRGTVKHRF